MFRIGPLSLMRVFAGAVLVHCAVVTGLVGHLAPLPPGEHSAAAWKSRAAGSGVSRCALRAEAPRAAPGPPRHPIYWIDECPPHNRTREIAARSVRNLPAFLQHKRVALYNDEAFAEARGAYAAYCARQCRQVGEVPLLLDSCCGTGRSTWNLAALRPDAFVIGVDKSLVRLTRNAAFRQQARPDADGDADPDSAEGSFTLAQEDEDTGDSNDDDLGEMPKGGQGRSGKPRPQRDNMVCVWLCVCKGVRVCHHPLL